MCSDLAIGQLEFNIYCVEDLVRSHFTRDTIHKTQYITQSIVLFKIQTYSNASLAYGILTAALQFRVSSELCFNVRMSFIN